MARVRIEPKWGEIYLTDFDPAIGSEIQKRRPAVIIQNDINNEFSDTTIVAAITSLKTKATYPTTVQLKTGEGGLDRDSIILLGQIRTMDKSRLAKKLGLLSSEQMYRVGKALSLSLGYAGF
jgi:mRNA interferase MazF